MQNNELPSYCKKGVEDIKRYLQLAHLRCLAQKIATHSIDENRNPLDIVLLAGDEKKPHNKPLSRAN